MLVGDAVASARDWVQRSTIPGFRGAFLAGSAAHRAGGEELPPWSDVDVRLVLDMEGRFGGMTEVATDALSGRLQARIAASYDFADTARALSDFATRPKTGKLLVRVRPGT